MSAKLFHCILVVSIINIRASAQTLQWEKILHTDTNTKFIKADANGNIYVAGEVLGKDIVTMKYDQNGNQLWAKSYNGPGNDADLATGLSIDAFGNVAVIGWSYSNPPCQSCKDYVTLKYSPSGLLLWSNGYDGSASGSLSDDKPNDVAADKYGNVFVTGYSYESSSSSDITTIKYANNGVEKWRRSFNGNANGADGGNDIVLDAKGNIYAAGFSVNPTGQRDFVVIKYDSLGNKKFSSSWNGPGNSNDEAYKLTLDSKGNIYLTGECTDTAGYYLDYAIVKFDSTGTFKWASTFDGPVAAHDRSYDVIVDAYGNSYITGYTTVNDANFYRQITTIKYDSAGVRKWVKNYFPVTTAQNSAKQIMFDVDGNILVGGMAVVSGTNSQAVIIKYDTAGTQFSLTRYNGTTVSCQLYSFDLDASGSYYLAGYKAGSWPTGGFVIVKYGTAGTGITQSYPDNYRDLYNVFPNPSNGTFGISIVR